MAKLLVILDFNKRNCCVITMHYNVSMLNASYCLKLVEQILIEL